MMVSVSSDNESLADFIDDDGAYDESDSAWEAQTDSGNESGVSSESEASGDAEASSESEDDASVRSPIAKTKRPRVCAQGQCYTE